MVARRWHLRPCSPAGAAFASQKRSTALTAEATVLMHVWSAEILSSVTAPLHHTKLWAKPGPVLCPVCDPDMIQFTRCLRAYGTR